MNWKLLLIALALVVGISARPTEESQATEQNASIETTTFITETPSTIPAVTKKLTKAPEKVTTPKSTTTTVRYLIASMPTKTTNVRHKYPNNYANLITKNNLINNRIISSNNSNKYVTLHDVVVDSSLPEATAVVTSSSTTSNSSSKPLVFVDADLGSQTMTTNRAFVPLKGGGGTWSNYNLEKLKIVPTRPKKPVIHKIISKWSDNPNEVFKIHGNENSLITTQTTMVNNLKDNLMQSAFNPGTVTINFDDLPAIWGQQFLNPQTTTFKPSSIKSVVIKRPIGVTKSNCKKLKIKFANGLTNTNELSSKEICDGINIQIDNKIENMNSQTTTADYEIPNNDKFEDSAIHEEYDSDEKQEIFTEVETQKPLITKPSGSLKGGGNKNKDKKKKKKPGGTIASQIDGDDDDDDDGSTPGAGTDVGSMVMTMMTMMAVFNPLNFGVWGIILAPMAAMLFGGICFAMYNFMHHPIAKQPNWPAHPPWIDPWPKPQEIIIKNRIKHSPIPIKVMHLHKHDKKPPQMIFSEPVDSYGPPIMSYSPHRPMMKRPQKSYGEPPQFYGEPPMMIDDYYPSAPAGGPYRRISYSPFRRTMKPTRNSYKFQLL